MTLPNPRPGVPVEGREAGRFANQATSSFAASTQRVEFLELSNDFFLSIFKSRSWYSSAVLRSPRDEFGGFRTTSSANADFCNEAQIRQL